MTVRKTIRCAGNRRWQEAAIGYGISLFAPVDRFR